MPDFGIAFFGGLASGVVLMILTLFFRRLLRRRSEGEAETRWSAKKLRPFVPIAIGFILIALGLSFFDTVGYYFFGAALFFLAYGVGSLE